MEVLDEIDNFLEESKMIEEEIIETEPVLIYGRDDLISADYGILEETDGKENRSLNVDATKRLKVDHQVSSDKVKKPQSMWDIYAKQNQERITKENHHLQLPEIIKLMGEMFEKISSDEKNALEKLVIEDRNRYQTELSARKDFKRTNLLRGRDELITGYYIPISRVKRTIRMDPDVHNLSRECLDAITKATELFIGHIAMKSFQICALRGTKQVTEADLMHAIYTNENLFFLKMDFPRKSKKVVSKSSKSTKKGGTSGEESTGKEGGGMKKMKDFFALSGGGKEKGKGKQDVIEEEEENEADGGEGEEDGGEREGRMVQEETDDTLDTTMLINHLMGSYQTQSSEMGYDDSADD